VQTETSTSDKCLKSGAKREPKSVNNRNINESVGKLWHSVF